MALLLMASDGVVLLLGGFVRASFVRASFVRARGGAVGERLGKILGIRHRYSSR